MGCTYIQISVQCDAWVETSSSTRAAERVSREKRRIERGAGERIAAKTGVIDAADLYGLAVVQWWRWDCGLPA